VNCLRCPHLRVGGHLRDELNCVRSGRAVRLYLADIGGRCAQLPADPPRRRNAWSKAELVWLRQNYHKLGPTKCARFLDRGAPGVTTKAKVLGLYVYRLCRWTPADDEQLRQAFVEGARLGHGRWRIAKDLMPVFGKHYQDILAHTRKLGVGPPVRRRWTRAEIATLQRDYAHLGPTILAEQFSRTQAAVWCKANKLGLARPGIKFDEALRRLGGRNHWRVLRRALEAGEVVTLGERTQDGDYHIDPDSFAAWAAQRQAAAPGAVAMP